MTGGSDKERAGAARAGERVEWVDVAKGLGIIAVVISHIWTRGWVRDLLYVFHMPLFFLLSGYMSRPRAMGAFLRKQTGAMLPPYVAFLLLITGWDVGFEHWRGHLPIFRDWSDGLTRLALGGSELRGPFTIFWFIPCLLVARLLQNAIALWLPDPRDRRWFALMGLCLAGGLWIGRASDFSPLGLLTVPVALVLLWLGALWQSCRDDRRLVAFGAGAAIAAAMTLAVPPLNMKLGDYGLPWLSLPVGAGLSLAVVWAARHLPEGKPGRAVAKMLGHAGRMSLVIMYLHVAVVHYDAP